MLTQTSQPQLQQDNNVELNAKNNFSKTSVVSETMQVLKAFLISFLVFLLSILVLNANAQTVNTFTSNTTWTCPAGVTSIKVECWGAGGAGGGANTKLTGGGGGGGGAYALNNTVAVIPGTIYTITVGTGGLGSTNNGANGGTSSFGSSVSAFGGVGGASPSSSSTSASGGSGATGGVGGTTYFAGGNGANSTFVSSSNYASGAGGGGAGSTAAGLNGVGIVGGNGGAPDGGKGGNGINIWPVAGLNGASIGAGGGGATRDNNKGTSRVGGNGADGQVKITYSLLSCSVFTAQATSLILLPNINNVLGSFTASVTASGYLIVMTTTASAPTNPVNGTTYTVGSSALGGTIISANGSTFFNATGLTSGTPYWFWIFSYRAPSACTGVITYNTTSPLNNNVTTGLPLCTATNTQPTSLILTTGVTNISGSFTASLTASGYLVVMTTSATAPSNPINGTTYTAGSAALGGTIITTGASTTFNAVGLTAGAQYWFWVFAFRAPTACSGVITYNTVAALSNNATLLPLCSAATPQPTSLILTAGVTNISGSFTASVGASGYLVVMTTTALAPASPINGNTYTVGSSALGGVILNSNNSTNFIASGLSSVTQYWFWVFSFRAPTSCSGVVTYNTVSPLSNTAITTVCGALVNTATITTYSSSFNWTALSWSLGHIPTACESVVITLDRSAATSNEDISINFDANFTINNFTMRNVSNTTRRIVFATSGSRTIVVNGNMTMECPGGTISNRFNRCVFGNAGNTTIYGNVTLGRVSTLTATSEGHSAIGSTSSTLGQTYTMFGNMTFNPRGYTTDEWAVFIFNKAGTQYIYNYTRPLTTDTIQPVLFEDLRIGTTNATTLIMQGTMFDGYIELVGRAGITIGNNSVLDLPSNYSLNVISGGSTSLLKMLANSNLRVGGDKSINDIYGGVHGVAGSNFPGGFTYNLDPTSTIEYYGNNSITQTIYNGVTYKRLLATNSVQSDMVAPPFPAGTAHAQKITTGPIVSNTSININGFADVVLGTLGSSTNTVQSDGPLNILTDGGIFCNANVVSGVGAFTMNSGSTIGMGHMQGISAVGSATGNIQMTGGRIYNLTGNYVYNGIVAQSTGTGLPSTSTNDLIIDNPTTVTLGNSQVVNGVHLLKQGVFNIQTNKITLNGLSTLNAVTGKMKADQGIVEMKGTSGVAQNLSGNWFVNKTISILTNANTTGITVAAVPADTLLISAALDYNAVTGSTITTNDNLTLLSRFTGTANFGNSTGNSIIGKVNVERYMAARSAWRLLATPIQVGTSPTISQAWRENNAAHTSTGYGTRITGPAGPFGAASILDDYSINPSMKSYNAATNNFTGVVNANTTPIANLKGYYVFVRGDRSAAAIIGLSGITNLRIKGDLRTGTQIFLVPANKFESVGNPFASRIDMRTVNKANIVNGFSIWNPNSAGSYNVGAYETYTWDGTNYVKPGGVIRNYIESGEAFYVQSNSTITVGSLTINETDKATGSANVSRPGVTTPTLEINLYAQNTDGSTYIADGVKLNYNNTFSAGVDNLDVRKINNTYDNLSIKNGNVNLIVERRPHIVNADTIKLNISGMRLAPYRIEIDPSVLTNPNLEGTFVDNYTGIRTTLSFTDITAISFDITNDAASRAVDRFMIVFKEISSTSFNNIAAARTVGKTVKVNWITQNEVGVTNYTVEHSTDGVNFTAIAAQTPTANNGTNPSYSYVDATASAGKNWYRVKVNIGTTLARFTAIAMVNELPITTTNANATMGIYPNPVEDGRVNFKLYNQAAGNYSVVITTATGQVVQRAIIKVQTNAVAQTINIGAASAGLYYATIIDEKGMRNTIAFMVK
jgi:Secretion system C-terminal sorting domain